MRSDRYSFEFNQRRGEHEVKDNSMLRRPVVVGFVKHADQAEALTTALNVGRGGYSYDHSRQDGVATLAILDSVDNIVAHFHPGDEDMVKELIHRLNGQQ